MAATISLFRHLERHARCLTRSVYAVFFAFLLLTGCAPSTQAEYFIPPAISASPTAAATVISLWTPTPTADAAPVATETSTPETLSTPTPAPSETSTPENCTNNLKFLADLTIPDGTQVNPGEKIDKQWRVLNSGTCNWDERYRLRVAGGFAPLGAEINQALFPARAGSEVTIQVFFVAPMASGTYRSAWQAYDSNGIPFGETIYIEITVP